MEKNEALLIEKQLRRIADALEESNKLKRKQVVIEKKKYQKDYIIESKDSKLPEYGKDK